MTKVTYEVFLNGSKIPLGDPIPYDLGNWVHVARKAKEYMESELGRILTTIPVDDDAQ
jgi:hypothetical protein